METIADERIASLRRSLVQVLGGGFAYAKPQQILADVPAAERGVRVDGVGRSLWEMLEHLRIDQREMLDLCTAETFAWLPPERLWPPDSGPSSEAAWDDSVAGFLADLAQLQTLAIDESIDLFAVVRNGSSETLLRVLQVTAEHNCYHLGQFVAMRKVLGAWRDA